MTRASDQNGVDTLVAEHFRKRAPNYDVSSRWCTDQRFLQIVVESLRLQSTDHLLDVACGTGLVSQAASPYVATVTGLDITPEMCALAGSWIKELVVSPAETMPFPNNHFDAIVCRQGLQFMDAQAALREMVRVLKPGGRLVIANLCAYDDEDGAEYFEVLRLRNPARRNFFVPGDLPKLLRSAGCTSVSIRDYFSVEDIDLWSENAAIDEQSREAIRQVYRNSSTRFREKHAVSIGPHGIADRMLFCIATGVK